jgi:GNAT superfamily N-acetyltransferase
MNSPIVRRACDEDLEQLCHLYVAFHEFHVGGVPDRLISLGKPELFDCTELMIKLRLLLDKPDVALFVALVNTQMIGFVEVYLRQDEENGANVAYRYGYLQSLMVMDAFRQHHIGTRLMEEAQQWASQQGATEMQLNIWEFPAGPLAFYEQLGYRTLRRTLVRSLAPHTTQAPHGLLNAEL